MLTTTIPLALLALLTVAGLGPAKGGDSTVAPTPRSSMFPSYRAFQDSLAWVTSLEDPAAREAQLDALWDALRAESLIPFVRGEHVAFLYRGDANELRVVGDFSGWKPSNNQARRLEPSDVWIQEEVLPLDARLDYKFIRDGQWVMDPDNSRTQVGGFGPNSELRMPGYVPSAWVVRRDDGRRGQLEGARSIASDHLGYTVSYQVYVPFSYEDLTDRPTIYVTDGHEYARDDMGSMVIVLDNLVAAGAIPPVIAVFIDPRVGGQNLRGEQYVLNQAFVDFVTRELVPEVDGAYRTLMRREARAILGTSLGGLNSAWFALRASDTFRLIAMQSPAFHAGNGAIVDRYREAPRLDVKMHMSWGTFFDFGESTREMVQILESKGYDLTTVTTHEGHSWGQWRALLDDVLIHFWGPD